MTDLTSTAVNLKPTPEQIVQPPILSLQWPDRSEAEIKALSDEHAHNMGIKEN